MNVPARCALVIAAAVACLGAAAEEKDLAAGMPGELEFRTELDLTYEYRYLSDEVLVEDYKIKNGIDLERDYLDRAPFARFRLDFGAPAGFSLGIGTTFRRYWQGDYFKADNLPAFGLEGNPFPIENYFMDRGVLYWNHPGISVAFGRDKVDYSNGLEGALLPSPRLPYLDSFRTRIEIGKFALDWMIASIQNRQNWEVGFYGDENYDVDPNVGLSALGLPDLFGFEDDPQATSVVEGLHRFSWDFGRWQLGAAGHIVYSRWNNRFYLSDFFPLLSWHQAEVLQTNLSLVFDAAWEPLDGLRLMAMGGFDDISADFMGVSDDGTPTIPAIVGGARYAKEIGPGRLSLYGEAGWTHWLWGNYDGSQMSPWDVNPLLRAQYRMLLVSGGALLPLTSPYGPGALWAKADASYALGDTGFVAGLELLYLDKNVDANLVTTAYDGNTTTADAARVHFISLSLPLSYSWKGLWVSAAPALLVKDGKPWFEATLAAGYRLRTSKAIGSAK